MISYQRKLRGFADCRNLKQRFFLQKALEKCAYLEKADIPIISEFEYFVPSEADLNVTNRTSLMPKMVYVNVKQEN